jgi:hypothetical protein
MKEEHTMKKIIIATTITAAVLALTGGVIMARGWGWHHGYGGPGYHHGYYQGFGYHQM